MNNEQDHLHSTTPLSLSLQPSILVAAATLVLAGSAVFLKSNLRIGNLRLLPKGLEGDAQSASEDQHEPHGGISAAIYVDRVMSNFRTFIRDIFTDIHEDSNFNDGSKFQTSRSKERRKRRKDPMKELTKGGKKAKDLAKLLKHVDLPGPSDPSSSSVPNSGLHSDFVPAQAPQEPSSNSITSNRNRSGSHSESGTRDFSASLSSRSVSICSAAGASARSGPSGDDHEEQDQEEQIPLTAMPPSPALPPEMNNGHSPSTSYGTPQSHAISMFSMSYVDTADTSVQSAKCLDLNLAPGEERSESIPSSNTPLPKLTSKNIRRNRNSNNDKNSSPDNFAPNKLNTTNGTDVSPAILTSSQSMPSSSSFTQSDQSKDAIDISSSTLNVISAPSRAGKPPRFRSQTRQEHSMGQVTSSSGVGLGFSTSMPIHDTSRAFSSTSKLDPDYIDGGHVENGDHTTSLTPLSFPTLNGTSGSGSTNESAPGSSKASSSAGFGTPPPGSTNSTSLSTQTQIASLRGALEASRKREEEARGRDESTRSELERLGNELKVLRWEGNVWRRREGELQAQIHHLVHQIQSYAVYFTPPQQFSPQLQNLAVPQPQRTVGKYPKGKRPQKHSQTSPTSSRSTSKSSRPSHSSHASPIPPLAQLPERQATSQGSLSSPVGSPIIPPSRMFSPPSTFSPGPSTPFLPNPQSIGPFSPSSSFGMFSPTGALPGGMPFASPHLGSTGMMSPLSPHSPYLPYPTYATFGGFSQSQNQANGSGNPSNGGTMHPMQFLNMLNNTGKGNGASAGSGTEPGGAMSTLSTMSSLNSVTTDSTDSMSPEMTSSPSPAPGTSRERGRKRGRGVAGTGNGDRILGGYGPEYQYGYSYGYPYPYSLPTSYQVYPGTASPKGEIGKEGEGPGENSDPEHDADGEVNELLAGSILKRPESMVGLRRSGSGGSSKSKAKEKLQMSPMKDVGFGNELRDGQQFSDDGQSVASPSSDSGVRSALGLEWLRDPGLFRRESSEAISTQRPTPALEAIPMSMPSSPPPSRLPFTSTTTPNEIDLDADIYSSSSSSSNKSLSESASTESSDSVAETPPIEFTFPSIATWGYSYRTHSAGDPNGREQALRTSTDVEATEDPVLEKHATTTTLIHDTDIEEEITPPADKLNPMSIESEPALSDTTFTVTPNNVKNIHDGTTPAE
ncbi:hypothetical protein F5051DRAFT_406976 [Lentinula edodes]|nr:hypothetical protein F5051DRAFT_406976 [Lentinula edodes]